MAAPTTDQLLDLVRRALDEIDDRPVSITTRRTARIASMLGETVLAVRLGLELKPSGGHPPTNAEDTRRLMHDPSLWGDHEGPAEQAVEAYMGNRRIGSGPKADLVDSHGLSELEAWLERVEAESFDELEWLSNRLRMTATLERVRHTCFTALCSWERQLNYANTNERIFERFRNRVDALLAAGAPDVLDQFSAVYRRLRDAASTRASPVSEELAQAAVTCRRILKAVADHLLPGEHGAVSGSGHALTDKDYKNRLLEYIKVEVASDTTEEALRAAVGGVFERFAAIDRLASKGVHADVGLDEAETCALHTYFVAGELLSLATE
jgi:hypothetical protein